jgi:4-hydroxybenzoate polyprenyltransferase
VSAARIAESAPFCGVTLLGGLMARPDAAGLVALGHAVAGVLLLASFAFAYNDLQDVEHDRRCGAKTDRCLVSGVVSVASMRWLVLGLAISPILVLAVGTPWPIVGLAVVTLILSTLYSWRPLPLKTVPGASSALHLLQGTLAFVLGAGSVAALKPTSFAVGLYFGLVFAAGHLQHEVADWHTDRLVGVRTHAVRFGPRTTLWIGFSVWSLSCAHFSAMAGLGFVPSRLAAVQLAMYAAYAIGFFSILRGNHDASSLHRLRRFYRPVYLAGGLLMVLLLLVP